MTEQKPEPRQGEQQQTAAPSPIPQEAERLLDIAVESERPAPGAAADSAPPTLSADAADAISGQLVNMAAGALQQAHPALRYDDATRNQVRQALTPVVVKYDGQLPPWLAKWQEEIMLAICLGSVAYNSVRAVKDYNAERKKEKEQSGAQHHDQGTAAAPAA